jgi:exonuclease SbcC
MDALAVRYHNLREERTAPFLAIEKTKNSLEQEQKSLNEKKRLVEEIQKDLPGKKAGLKQDQELISRLVEQINRKPEIENQLAELRLQKEDLSADNKRLQAEMNLLVTRRNNLQTTHDPICPFCGQDLTLDHRQTLVGEILANGKKLGDEHRENQTQISILETRQKALEGELQTISRLETEKHALDRKTDLTHAWLSDREPEVDDWITKGHLLLKEVDELLRTESFAKDERTFLARLDQVIAELGYNSGAHDDLRQQEKSLRTMDAEFQQLERTRSAIAPLERQITDLTEQQTATHNELLSLEKSTLEAEKEFAEKTTGMPDIAKAELEYRQIIEEENKLRDETTAARQKVEVLDSLRRKKADFDKERDTTGRTIGQYKQLERAFGKDGVPALLIEQALPEIENEANDLLDRLTAGEMSVRFITQRDYKDRNREDKKETLDIQISDATGVRDYEMFSGGEAFRVNFAIRLALSRVLAQRAGARLQTLVIDEGFGSQDAIGRQRLVEAINMVQSDFARILVITHLEELKDAFPSRIEVEKASTGSVVHVMA